LSGGEAGRVAVMGWAWFLEGVSYRMDDAAQQRLDEYFSTIGSYLRNKWQRASFALYAVGLLGESPRKSMEPIAAQLCPDPDAVEAVHNRLQHFLVDAPWSDREVRRAAARYAVGQMTKRSPVTAWIVDDTGFLKQGTHSVGVQRQYTGSAGKIANCQVAPSLTISTPRAHVPVDMELYLPRCWTDDPKRRKEARIPDEVEFRTKPELALLMLRRAREDGLPTGVVLADCAFGDSLDFRTGVAQMGLDYGVGIEGRTLVMVLGRKAQRSEPILAQDLAHQLGPKAFKKITWREGTKKPLRARFAFRRVLIPGDPLEKPLWLVMEWPQDEDAPTKFYLCSLPARTPKKALVRLLKERYRTEQAYEELKGELGLDHYEGRRYPGWHHHISAVLACYAFVVAERERPFPPSARRTAPDCPFALAA
jgi:SRSO17 transposase